MTIKMENLLLEKKFILMFKLILHKVEGGRCECMKNKH